MKNIIRGILRPTTNIFLLEIIVVVSLTMMLMPGAYADTIIRTGTAGGCITCDGNLSDRQSVFWNIDNGEIFVNTGGHGITPNGSTQVIGHSPSGSAVTHQDIENAVAGLRPTPTPVVGNSVSNNTFNAFSNGINLSINDIKRRIAIGDSADVVLPDASSTKAIAVTPVYHGGARAVGLSLAARLPLRNENGIFARLSVGLAVGLDATDFKGRQNVYKGQAVYQW